METQAAKTITDADYADGIALLANAPTQAETLQHSLERDAAGIGLYVNTHKTECMCFNQTGNISTQNGSCLKLVDKFTYYMDANETDGEEAWRQLHKNAASNVEQVLEATPHKAAAIRPLTNHHENYQS